MNLSALLFFALLAAAAALAWRARARGWAAGFGAFAVLPAVTLLEALGWTAFLLGGGLVTLLGWARWSQSATRVNRWSTRLRRKSGVASWLDIARRGGAVAMRASAAQVRPSLAGLSRAERARLAPPEVAVELCRVGPQRVWASIEHVVLVIGGPRMGKSGWLGGRIVDAPGALVATSTRTDLLRRCGPLRARRGPVWVFNAVGHGDHATTAPFDPLVGCADPMTAIDRAADLVAGGNAVGQSSHAGGDAERWDAQARRVLAALLHAAALSGASMHDVLAWVADNDRAAGEVPAILRRSGVAAFAEAATQFVTTNDRTRTSITNSIMPALGWLTSPVAAAAARPGCGFDVAAFLAARGSLFIVGAEQTQAAPLMTALTGHIAREARRLAEEHTAGLSQEGRLDPNLTFALDEAALIVLPLDSWTADMGGRGITILACFQSRAQLLARYGVYRAAAILNNVAAILLFGGTRDREDLQFWSTLAGERDESIRTTDLHGRVASRTVRKVAVFAPAQIANLAPGQVICYRSGIDPVLGRAAMVWRRRDVRAHDAGYPTEAGVPGVAGRLTYARLMTRDSVRTAASAAAAVGRRVAGPVTAWIDVAGQWLRFLAGRVTPAGRGRRRSGGPYSNGFVGAGPSSHADRSGPLRVASQRGDRPALDPLTRDEADPDPPTLPIPPLDGRHGWGPSGWSQ